MTVNNQGAAKALHTNIESIYRRLTGELSDKEVGVHELSNLENEQSCCLVPADHVIKLQEGVG